MAMTLITTNNHTGDSDTVSTFNSSIDSTYKLYIFKFIDINPATDAQDFSFQGNAAGGSGYDEPIVSTFFEAYSAEDGTSGAALIYLAANDQIATDAAFQPLTQDTGNDADQSCAGTLWLFNPSNTTYVKHFYSRVNQADAVNFSVDCFSAGYFNTTSAIDEIQFKFPSGNFNGTIKMYGVG